MPTSDELKLEGNKAFTNKEYKKAAKIYRDAIKLNPNNPILYSNRAMCFIKQEDWDRALQDCTSGLKIRPDPKTEVKLLYRKGLAYKNLNMINKAEKYFEDVLNLDPKNIAAMNELKFIGSTKSQSKKTKLEKTPSTKGSFPIPIKEVDSLPEEYSNLTNSESPMSESSTVPVPTPSDNVEVEINKVFDTTRQANPKCIEEKHLTVSSSEKPSMYYLSTLSSLKETQKVNGYKFVINLNPDIYQDIFGSTGIDSEFLAFFLEAAAYVSKNNMIDNWQVKILELLSTFSKQRRFELSLSFCSKDHIQELINNIKSLNDQEILNSYTTFFLGI